MGRRKKGYGEIAREVFEGLERRDRCWIAAVGARAWMDLAESVGALDDVPVEDLDEACKALDDIVEAECEDALCVVLRLLNDGTILQDNANPPCDVEDVLEELAEAGRQGEVDEGEYGLDEHGNVVPVKAGYRQSIPTYRVVDPDEGEDDDEETDEGVLVCANCGWEGDEEDAETGDDGPICPECGEELEEADADD